MRDILEQIEQGMRFSYYERQEHDPDWEDPYEDDDYWEDYETRSSEDRAYVHRNQY